MSRFKWLQTIAMARALGVAGYLAKGINTHENDTNMNIDGDLISEMKCEVITTSNNTTSKGRHAKDKYSMPKLVNAVSNIRLKRIVYEEYHSIDTSVLTLNILEIIIKNINGMMDGGADIYELIQLGLFLRQKGQSVDFVKIDIWLERLGIKRMTDIIGNMLILLFGFEDDEIPFMHKKNDKAAVVIRRYMDNLQTTTSIIQTDVNGAIFYGTPTIPRQGICTAITYFKYMPAEAVFRTVSNFTRRLSEIEE